MRKYIDLLQDCVIILSFILLGIGIFQANPTLFGQVVGISCSIFFSILFIWLLVQKLKENK